MVPAKSTAAQSDRTGQDTPTSPDSLWVSSATLFQAEAPPPGSVELITSPVLLSALSTAAQNEADAHETAVRFAWQFSPGPCFPQLGGVDVGTVNVFQALEPPVGDALTARPPASPAATQKETDGQETPAKPSAGIVRVVQTGERDAGSVVVSTSLPPTATHNDREGQEMPLAPVGMCVTLQLALPAIGSVETTRSPAPIDAQKEPELQATAPSPPVIGVASRSTS
jgi:hypothetical protein